VGSGSRRRCCGRVSSGQELPARFTPLERASVGRRAAVAVFGPLLWLAGIVFVSVVVDRAEAVEVGLIVTLVAFVVSLFVCVLARRRRLSEERDAVEA
jgi:hypothetical protein